MLEHFGYGADDSERADVGDRRKRWCVAAQEVTQGEDRFRKSDTFRQNPTHFADLPKKKGPTQNR